MTTAHDRWWREPWRRHGQSRSHHPSLPTTHTHSRRRLFLPVLVLGALTLDPLTTATTPAQTVTSSLPQYGTADLPGAYGAEARR